MKDVINTVRGLLLICIFIFVLVGTYYDIKVARKADKILNNYPQCLIKQVKK